MSNLTEPAVMPLPSGLRVTQLDILDGRVGME